MEAFLDSVITGAPYKIVKYEGKFFMYSTSESTQFVMKEILIDDSGSCLKVGNPTVRDLCSLLGKEVTIRVIREYILQTSTLTDEQKHKVITALAHPSLTIIGDKQIEWLKEYTRSSDERIEDSALMSTLSDDLIPMFRVGFDDSFENSFEISYEKVKCKARSYIQKILHLDDISTIKILVNEFEKKGAPLDITDKSKLHGRIEQAKTYIKKCQEIYTNSTAIKTGLFGSKKKAYPHDDVYYNDNNTYYFVHDEYKDKRMNVNKLQGDPNDLLRDTWSKIGKDNETLTCLSIGYDRDGIVTIGEGDKMSLKLLYTHVINKTIRSYSEDLNIFFERFSKFLNTLLSLLGVVSVQTAAGKHTFKYKKTQLRHTYKPNGGRQRQAVVYTHKNKFYVKDASKKTGYALIKINN